MNENWGKAEKFRKMQKTFSSQKLRKIESDFEGFVYVRAKILLHKTELRKNENQIDLF
jgi:hypothetical protein